MLLMPLFAAARLIRDADYHDAADAAAMPRRMMLRAYFDAYAYIDYAAPCCCRYAIYATLCCYRTPPRMPPMRAAL